jgi:hypothetical protein
VPSCCKHRITTGRLEGCRDLDGRIARRACGMQDLAGDGAHRIIGPPAACIRPPDPVDCFLMMRRALTGGLMLFGRLFTSLLRALRAVHWPVATS